MPEAAATCGLTPIISKRGLYRVPPPIPTVDAIVPQMREKHARKRILRLVHRTSSLSNLYPSSSFNLSSRSVA